MAVEETVAAGALVDDAAFAELFERFTKCGGAHAAELAELLDGGGRMELDQRVEHALGGRRFLRFGRDEGRGVTSPYSTFDNRGLW